MTAILSKDSMARSELCDCARAFRRRGGGFSRSRSRCNGDTVEDGNCSLSARAIWSGDLLQNLCASAFLTVFVSLGSCDSNLFSRESREIAGGFHLKRADNPNQFVLTIPNEGGGLIIDEIGWSKPLIVARASGSQYWDVINTAHAQHTRISDLQRKSDPNYQFIQIISAETAWKGLNRHKRSW